MDLYLIRHAEAQPLGENGIVVDADRPLTEVGKEQARKLGLCFLRRGIVIDQLISSPWLRAQQTADELAHIWGMLPDHRAVSDTLIPDSKFRKLAKYINEGLAISIALVGHEPHLSEFAAWLLGSKKVQIIFGKATVAHIEIDGSSGKGMGTLHWLLPSDWQ